jgi:hypothetical protein
MILSPDDFLITGVPYKYSVGADQYVIVKQVALLAVTVRYWPITALTKGCNRPHATLVRFPP